MLYKIDRSKVSIDSMPKPDWISLDILVSIFDMTILGTTVKTTKDTTSLGTIDRVVGNFNMDEIRCRLRRQMKKECDWIFFKYRPIAYDLDHVTTNSKGCRFVPIKETHWKVITSRNIKKIIKQLKVGDSISCYRFDMCSGRIL